MNESVGKLLDCEVAQLLRDGDRVNLFDEQGVLAPSGHDLKAVNVAGAVEE